MNNNILVFLLVIFANLSFCMEHINLFTSIEEALEKNNVELLKEIAQNNQAMKNLRPDNLRELFRLIKKVSHAQIILDAGYKPTRGTLHYIMWSSDYEPALVALYLACGASSLETDKDEMTDQEYRACNTASTLTMRTNPQLPLQTLAQFAKHHKTANEVLAKCDYLVEGLNAEKLQQMLSFKADRNRDVRSMLQRVEHPHNVALLQRINAFYDRIVVEESKK